jgi:transposase-like protein
LEAEVTEFWGRDRYQRAAACPDARPGSRNGYREMTVKTTAGPVELARPRLRGASEAFASRLFGSQVTKTNALESLVIARSSGACRSGRCRPPWLRRSATRAAIVKSTVSAICGQITGEYQA